MTTEQFWSLIVFILVVVIMSGIVYSRRRRKFGTLIFRPLFPFLFILLAILTFIKGDAFWAFWAWASSTLALSLALHALAFIGRELNEKLVISLMLVVEVAGGIPANVYVFLMSTGVLARILSLSMLILIVAPTLMSLIAYFIGKRRFSKKLINTLILGKGLKKHNGCQKRE